MKHQAAEARRRPKELTFGNFIVRTAAIKSVNGIGHINRLLRICAGKGYDVIGLQETNETEFLKLWQSGIASTSAVIAAGLMGGKGKMEWDWW